MPRGIPNRKPAPKRIMVATETFLTLIHNVPVTIHKGTTVREGHPLYTGREMYFKPLVVEYDHLPAQEDEPEIEAEEKGFPPAA